MLDLSAIRQKMTQALEAIKADVATIRTGRAAPSLIEDVIVSAYGGTQQLKVMELGTISAPEPHMLTVKPWDASVLGEIAKGINQANLGIQAVVDNDLVRINIPPLTEERRRQFVKLLKTKIEAGKVMIRQIRHEQMIHYKKAFEAKEINEDDKFRHEEELQKITDEFVDQIDDLYKAKEQELLTV
jgi:ribosome recycling factor